MRKQLAALGGFLVSIASLAAQQTFIVDINGGGDFTQIKPAVDAANAGDIIRLRHGEYEAVTISKGIRLLAEPRGETHLDFVNIYPWLTVRDLPPSEIFVATDIYTDSLTAETNLGSVYLSRVIAQMTITDCVDLSMHRCNGAGAGIGARIVNSRVLDVRGSFYGLGGHGLVLERSQMTLVDSRVLGSSFGRSGTTAAVLTDSEVLFSPGTRVSGGTGLFGDKGRDFQLYGKNSATTAAHSLIIEDSDSLDSITVEMQSGYVSPHLLVAGSLAARPMDLPSGTFYLDQDSIQLFFHGVSSIDDSREKRIGLPPEYSPNIHRRGTYPDRSAPAGSEWLGIPITFQAMVTDRNGNRSLSLPYMIVF